MATSIKNMFNAISEVKIFLQHCKRANEFYLAVPCNKGPKESNIMQRSQCVHHDCCFKSQTLNKEGFFGLKTVCSEIAVRGAGPFEQNKALEWIQVIIEYSFALNMIVQKILKIYC